MSVFSCHASWPAVACDTRFGVLMALNVTVAVFWDVTPSSLIDGYKCYGGIYCLHIHLLPWRRSRLVPLKHLYPSIRLQSMMSQETLILIVYTVRFIFAYRKSIRNLALQILIEHEQNWEQGSDIWMSSLDAPFIQIVWCNKHLYEHLQLRSGNFQNDENSGQRKPIYMCKCYWLLWSGEAAFMHLIRVIDGQNAA
jgi:hypothetical protein